MSNKPKFLLEVGPHSERIEEFCNICDELGFEWKSAENYLVNPDSYQKFNASDNVCTFGTLGFVKKIQMKTPLVPGSYCDFDSFKVSTYINHYYKYMFNLGIFSPMGYFTKNIPQFMKALGITDGRFFIRPDGGDKQFTGCVIGMSDTHLVEYLASRANLNTMCYICPAQETNNEYRLFMHHDKVVTGSQYRNSVGIHHGPVNDKIIAAAELFAAKNWLPEPLWVIDIHEDASGEMSIMELNSWSCSGWYQSDLRKIIEATAQQMKVDYDSIFN